VSWGWEVKRRRPKKAKSGKKGRKANKGKKKERPFAYRGIKNVECPSKKGGLYMEKERYRNEVVGWDKGGWGRVPRLEAREKEEGVGEIVYLVVSEDAVERGGWRESGF